MSQVEFRAALATRHHTVGPLVPFPRMAGMADAQPRSRHPGCVAGHTSCAGSADPQRGLSPYVVVLVLGTNESMCDLVEDRVTHFILVVQPSQWGAEADQPLVVSAHSCPSLGTVELNSPAIESVQGKQAIREVVRGHEIHEPE